MNALYVGRDKTPILEHLPSTFLLIDDEIDITIPRRRKVVRFDVSKHSFNPLKDVTVNRARAIASTIYDAFPQGENTLTVRNGKRALTKILLTATRLDRLKGSRRDPAIAEALDTIDDVLLSDVLKNVLCQPINFSLDGIILAKLNRAELGDFDCFVLANLLIGQYQGQVVIPDFGFYACPFHRSLIRQNRLIAGVNSLDEVDSTLRSPLLLIDPKIGKHCTAQDAEVLAGYMGLTPHSNAYNTFIERAIE